MVMIVVVVVILTMIRMMMMTMMRIASVTIAIDSLVIVVYRLDAADPENTNELGSFSFVVLDTTPRPCLMDCLTRYGTP